MKIKKLENFKIEKALHQNEGYCPCSIVKNIDTKCMCKDFRLQKEPGKCHCGLFQKIK